MKKIRFIIMLPVKYRCKKCGYSELPKLRDFFGRFIMQLFAMIGIISIFLLLLYLFVLGKNPAIDYENNLVSQEFTDFARQHDTELRDVAVNFTSACDNSDAVCYSTAIFQRLRTIRYIPSSKYRILYSPIYVYNNGGDCRNLAAMYVALLESVGIDANVDCNVQVGHCVATVPIKQSWETEYDKIAVVDLTSNDYFIVDKETDFWQENYIDKEE